MESHGDEVLEACLTGNTETVRIYLETGVPVDTYIEGTLPIIAASFNGHSDTIKCLDGGATADLLDSKGLSALIAASSEGHVETVKILLEHGANVDLQNSSGQSALMIACGQGHIETAKILLHFGAQVDL